VQNDRLDMRLNLARPRATGASRRSALRAPSALRAAARRSFVTNMKIEPKIVFDIKTLAKNRLRRAMWLLIYSYLIGGGAARLAETQPLTEERVVRPPPCVRDPTLRMSR
jgi:hypothetical protein